MSRHVSSVHEKKKPFQCNLCGKCFTENGSVTKHITTIHEGIKLFLCNDCGSKFGTKSELSKHTSKKHNTSIHDGKMLSKYEFSINSITKKELRKTVENKTSNIGKVKDGQLFIKNQINKQNFQKGHNVQKDIGENIIIKKIQAYLTNESEDIRSKIEMRDDSISKNVSNNDKNMILDTDLISKTTFDTEINQNFDSIYSPLDETNKNISKKNISSVYDDKSPFECEDCQSNKLAFDGKGQFYCEICGSNFATSHTLDVHIIKIHKEKGTYDCNICTFNFTQKSEAFQHLSSVHKRRIPFQCNICGDWFTEKVIS